MALNEVDREDLIRDATAYNFRGELQLTGEPGPLFFGRKNRGGYSYYFDQDPVYHWTDSYQLRRAFIDGKLYRTQGETLAQLTRERTDTTSELLRKDLNDCELAETLAVIKKRLLRLQAQLLNERISGYRGTVTEDEYLREITRVTGEILQQPTWLAPRIPGKR